MPKIETVSESPEIIQRKLPEILLYLSSLSTVVVLADIEGAISWEKIKEGLTQRLKDEHIDPELISSYVVNSLRMLVTNYYHPQSSEFKQAEMGIGKLHPSVLRALETELESQLQPLVAAAK